MWKGSLWWLPYLTMNRKKKEAAYQVLFLDRFQRQCEAFLKCIVTMDKPRLYLYELESNEQSMVLKYPSSSSRRYTDYWLCPPSKKRGHIARHMLVRLAVCNLFVSDQWLKNTLTYLPQTLYTHQSWAAEEPYWFWGHWVKGQGQQGQMCQNHMIDISTTYISCVV